MNLGKILFILALFSAVVFSAQDDTVMVYMASMPPIVDGYGNDECWRNAKWQPIDQVWMPYNAEVDSSDYWGRYKIMWSEEENLLYFLVEIYDDIAVGGLDLNNVQGIYNYDVLEVFIDEDKSGGLHVFDGIGSFGEEWGTNAENAFAYHIFSKFPDDGGVNYEKVVSDIAGTDWSHREDPNYADHFPEFALRRQGNLYTREFSLKVYDDTYEHSNPEDSRVKLCEGKIFGLSVAYCENDDPNEFPKKRDNFFGSVWVAREDSNNHWINADLFGTAKLIGKQTGIKMNYKMPDESIFVYPNPSVNDMNLVIQNGYTGKLEIKLYNLLGQELFYSTVIKNDLRMNYNIKISDNSIPTGVYFLKIDGVNFKRSLKVFMVNE
ncbi:MAG: T9SS type A sorting domain-containing protein [Candidatus Marinimicrobia bacterium]|nr:T9SS type A sorting domain-containing protein [Candidatus Neomarinimicrobiota bacterium]